MSKRDGFDAGNHNHREHGTVRDTVRITRERLRSIGMSRGDAEAAARRVADDAHRSMDEKQK